MDDPAQEKLAGPMWVEAARRWREATELGAMPATQNEWYERALAEFRAGDTPSASDSIYETITFGGSHAGIILLRARISHAQGQSLESVLTLTARAWDLADRVGDFDQIEEILKFRDEVKSRPHWRALTRHARRTSAYKPKPPTS